jgi:RimJ/RimL family protein N-acetyltransferase
MRILVWLMEDIYLRALETSDLDRTWKWHNDPGLYELLVSPFRYVSRAAEEEWLRQKAAYSQTEIQLAICLKRGDQHIGNVHLTNIDWVARHACVGIFLGAAEHRSKGYGRQALRLLLRHAFQDLGLQRVYLTVLADNRRAIRAYEKCGLVVEGRLRRHAYKQGQFKDLLFMSICAGDPGCQWVKNAGRDETVPRQMAPTRDGHVAESVRVGSAPREVPEPVETGMVTGYLHPGHAESLAEFGTPRELPHCGGWLLERAIPGAAARDAMGCYPLFACRDWSALATDLEDLGEELVSVALVADPFGDFDRTLLEECFDIALPFKEHFIADLREPPESIASKHHHKYALKALEETEVRVCAEPRALLQEWVALYRTLTERHGLTGIRAFSRTAFAKQLALPGLVALRAERQGRAVAANLFYVQGETAYDHLTASSPEGYEHRASYALKWCALQYFRDKVRWIDWGGGAGAAANPFDGLTMFKRGWSQTTRPAYLCGRILDPTRYRQIVQAKNLEHNRWFPAYRAGEFA